MTDTHIFCRIAGISHIKSWRKNMKENRKVLIVSLFSTKLSMVGILFFFK